MPDRLPKSVLILGGAGFIGSNLAAEFVQKGCKVTVIDGLLKRTGGRVENLRPILAKIEFIPKPIGDIDDLPNLLKMNELFIDCMAWTAHLQALVDPKYDLLLNVSSHLHFLTSFISANIKGKKIVYLGSRGQYGHPVTKRITEQSVMEPGDIQGIHKLAAESYFRVFARMHSLNVVSLRIPNCFGENQLLAGDDIGLIGGLIRDILKGNEVRVFGRSRKRELIYVKDLCGIISKIAATNFQGFAAYNVRGDEAAILDLTKMLIKIIGSGRYRILEVPDTIKALDPSPAFYSDAKLTKLIGKTKVTPLKETLSRTVDYFRRQLS